MGEVVRPRAPVLQLHVTELRVRTNQQLDRADVQPRGVGMSRGRFFQERGGRIFLEDHERVAKVGCSRFGKADQAV